MRTTLASVAALSLLQLAAARPHAHIHQHHARGVAEAQSPYVQELQAATSDYATALLNDLPLEENAELAAQYVETYKAITTDYRLGFVRYYQSILADWLAAQAPPPPPKHIKEVVPSVAAPPPPPAQPTVAPPAPPPPAPEPNPAQAPAPKKAPVAAPPPPAALPAEGAAGHGVSYAPYNDDSSCKSVKQVTDDFGKLARYPVIRMYGTDCNQVSTGLTAARVHGQKLLVGIWDINRATAEADIVIAAAKGNWDHIDTVAVGNEAINSGRSSVGQVVGAVNAVRGKLRAAGFQGPVVTVDTYNQIIAHPELCHASDYVAANTHPFFTPTVTAHQAGEFVRHQSEVMASVCPGKRVVITETGWPHRGSNNGAAVPSKENQQIALTRIREAFNDKPSNLILFSAFDDTWKKDNGGTFGAEKFWGIH